jgi:hypothetical protein
MTEPRHSTGVLSAVAALVLAMPGAAWGQQPLSHGAWADRDASGRAAAIPFREVHGRGFTHDRAVEKLTAAGCRREDTDTFIRFDCEGDPNRWYLTKPGRAEHPGIAVAADDEKGGSPEGSHTFFLSEVTLRPQEPSVERQEAFAVWSESLPLHKAPPQRFAAKPMDWNALFKDAPLTQEQMRGSTLTFEEALAALEGAKGCKRETADAYILFNCPTSRTRWFFTREGQAAHPMLVLGAHRSYTVAGEEDRESYTPVMQKRYSADGRMLGREESAKRNEIAWAWIGTLPGFGMRASDMPPLGFSLANSPFTDQDIRGGGLVSGMLTHDSAMQKLTAAGCARKDAGEYIAFTCKGSSLLFVMSSPDSPAHPAMMIAEPDPSGRAMRASWSRRIYTPGLLAQQLTPGADAAHSKWMRGISYLPMSQLR